MKEVFWCQGQYDGVLVFDAPSDEVAAGLIVSLGSLGNIRTQLLRACTEGDMKGILAKMG